MGSGTGQPRFANVAGYDVVRVALGLLLLVAAGSKALGLTQRPVDVSLSLSSHWATALAVEVELAVGLLLLVALWATFMARLATVLFALFACVSAYKVFAGHPSCGCFGSFQVPPENTLAIDLLAVVLLILFRPPWRQPSTDTSHAVLRATTFAVGLVCGSGLLIWSMDHWRPVYDFHEFDETPNFLGPIRDSVSFVPGAWIGCVLPFKEHIDIGMQWGGGPLRIVALPVELPTPPSMDARLLGKGKKAFGVTEDYRAAMVRLDGDSRAADAPFDGRAAERELLLGRLDDSKHSVIPSPTVVVLQDGKTVRVREGPDSS